MAWNDLDRTSQRGTFKNGSIIKLPLLLLQVSWRGAISAVITYHNIENRPKGGICVANHTSPKDVCMLALAWPMLIDWAETWRIPSYVQAQKLSKASSQIWFERGESKDRAYVCFNRLRASSRSLTNFPILNHSQRDMQ